MDPEQPNISQPLPPQNQLPKMLFQLIEVDQSSSQRIQTVQVPSSSPESPESEPPSPPLQTTLKIFYSLPTYPQFPKKDPSRPIILPDKQDARLLKLAIKNGENLMISVAERIIVDQYLMSCLYKGRKEEFMEGFKVGLTLCQVSDIGSKIKQSAETITKNYQAHLQKNQKLPLQYFLSMLHLLSKMFQLQNFYQTFYNEPLCPQPQHEYWQKFQQNCVEFRKEFFKLVDFIQDQEERFDQIFHGFFGFYLFGDALGVLEEMGRKGEMGGDGGKGLLNRARSNYWNFKTEITKICADFEPPIKFQSLKISSAINSLPSKNPLFHSFQTLPIFPSAQSQIFPELLILYSSASTQQFPQRLCAFIKKWTQIFNKNKEELGNFDYSLEFNLFGENYGDLGKVMELFLGIFGGRVGEILGEVSSGIFRDGNSEVQKEIIGKWLISYVKQVIQLDKVFKSYQQTTIPKKLLTLSTHIPPNPLPSPHQNLHLQFTIALIYRSIYEYKLMVDFLLKTVDTKILDNSQFKVEKEYYCFLVAIGYWELDMPEHCLEFLGKQREVLGEIGVGDLGDRARALLLARYDDDDYDKFMETEMQDIKSDQLPSTKYQYSEQDTNAHQQLQTKKISQILSYQKQIRNCQISLLMALQYRKILLKSQSSSQSYDNDPSYLDQIQDNEISEYENFTKIYNKYNFIDKWVECLKLQYYIISDRVHKFMEENNQISDGYEDRRRKRIKRKIVRFKEAETVDSKAFRYTWFSSISDDIERSVFERQMDKEDLFKACEFIERWYRDFPKGTMKKLATNFSQIYYKKKYNYLKSGINKQQPQLWTPISKRGPWQIYLHNKLHKANMPVHVYVYKTNPVPDDEELALYEVLKEKAMRLYNLRSEHVVEVLHYQDCQMGKAREIYVYVPIPVQENIHKFISVKKILTDIIRGLSKITQQIGPITSIPQTAITILTRDHCQINPLQCHYQFEEPANNTQKLDQNKFLHQLQQRLENESQVRAGKIPDSILRYLEFFREYLGKKGIRIAENPEEGLRHYIFWGKYKLCKMIDQFCEVVDLQRKTFPENKCDFRYEINSAAYQKQILFEYYKSKSQKTFNNGNWQNFLTQKQRKNILAHVGQDKINNYSEKVWVNGKEMVLGYFQLYDKYLRFIRNSVHHYLEMGGGGLKVSCDIELMIKKEEKTPRMVDFMFGNWDFMENTKKLVYNPQPSDLVKRKQFQIRSRTK